MPKKHSYFRFFLEYILIAFLGYLLLSLCVSVIGEHSYRGVLTSIRQLTLCWALYWWLPASRMVDMWNHNMAVERYYERVNESINETIEEAKNEEKIK